MFTQTVPALQRDAYKFLPASAMDSLSRTMGNCAAPLTHRGPIMLEQYVPTANNGMLPKGQWSPTVYNFNLGGGPGVDVAPPYGGRGGNTVNNYAGNQFDFSTNNQFSTILNQGGPTFNVGGGTYFNNQYTNNLFTSNFITQVINGNPGPSPPGAVGPAGKDGRDGAAGADGTSGGVGPRGSDGLPGLSGMPGPSGPPGSPGRSGSPGSPGAPGAAGQNGISGRDGRNGTDGAAGPAGQAGAAGRDGARGDSGQDGRNGNNGANGAAGRDGLDGREGRDGMPGRDGMDGAPGLPGIVPPFNTKPFVSTLDVRSGDLTATSVAINVTAEGEIDPETCKITITCKADPIQAVTSGKVVFSVRELPGIAYAP